MPRTRPGRPRSRPLGMVPLTVLLSPRAKRRAKALAQVQGRPTYQVMESAFWSLWKSLPEDKRDAAEAIAALIEEARGEDR